MKNGNQYTILGPFNINYSGKGIEKIQIKTDQKELISNRGDGKIAYADVWNRNYWQGDFSGIKSGVDFYIKVNKAEADIFEGTNLKVTFFQEGMTYYKARLVLALNPAAEGQNLGIYAAEQKSYTGQVTFNIQQERKADLTVIKYGENNVKQKDVYFRIGTGVSGKGFATWGNYTTEADGTRVYTNITYSDWNENYNASGEYYQQFKTGESGKFIIKEMDASYSYAVWEIANNNEGYEKVDIKNATLSNGVAAVELNFNGTDDGGRKNQVIGVRLSTTQENKLEIIDKKEPQENTLRVIKYGVYEEDGVKKEKEQSNVLFIINKKGKGYLKYNKDNGIAVIDGNLEYNETDFSWVENRNDASLFETLTKDNENKGFFEIKKLPEGTYYIGEVDNPNTGYEHSVIDRCVLEKYEENTKIESKTIENIAENDNIDGFTSNKLQVVEIELKKDGYTKVLKVYDTPEVKGINLKVIKYGVDGEDVKGEEQEGVGFIIHKNSSGYIKYKDKESIKIEELEYNEADFKWIENRDEATIFETTDKGSFRIINLPAGTYNIGEVYNKVPSYESSKIIQANIERYNGETIVKDIPIMDIKESDNISGYTSNKMQVITVALQRDGYDKVLKVYDSSEKEQEDHTFEVVKYGEIDGNKENQKQVGFIINRHNSGYLKYKKDNNTIVKKQEIEYNDTDFEWIDDREKATIFETMNEEGSFKITRMPSGKYYVGEVYNKNEGFESSIITKGDLKLYEEETLINTLNVTEIKQNDNLESYQPNKIQVVTIELYLDGYEKVLTVYDAPHTGFRININKTNTSGTKLEGARFKIKVFKNNQNIGWLYCENPNAEADEMFKYKYKNSYNEATTWNTSTGTSNNNLIYAKSKGKLEIIDLSSEYQYEIHEIAPATGYIALEDQTRNGMTVTVNSEVITMNRTDNYIPAANGIDASIRCCSVTFQEHGATAEVKVTNIKNSDIGYIDIEGVIWKDNYNKSYSNKYESGEEIRNATVKLRLVSNGNEVASTTTGSNGKYKFNGSTLKITERTVSRYYVELSYSGIDTQYRITTYGEGGTESRAKFQDVGLAWTDKIDSSDYTHVNIGIQPIPSGTVSVDKWIDKIEVKIKGNTYTYNMDGSSPDGGVGGIGVGSAQFYRTLYASDIVYSLQDDVTDGLEAYITYKISVLDEYTTWEPQEVDGNIKEKYITATVTDIYDPAYFELCDSNWNVTSKGNAKYKQQLELKNPKYGSPQSKTLSIKFKLTDKNSLDGNALKHILEEGGFTAGNTVQVSGKHFYDLGNEEYNEETEEMEFEWLSKQASYTTQQASAPGMTFSIYEYGQEDEILERTITGRVFEDNRINSTYEEKGEVLGDGIYNLGENIVENVTVELLNVDVSKTIGGGSIAKRYVYDGTRTKGDGTVINKYKILEGDAAKVTTTTNGTYEITGVIPR